MTIMHDRLVFQEHTEEEGELPEVTLQIVENEPERRAFLEQFGKKAIIALQRFAERREGAGMGPQNLTAIHPDGIVRSHEVFED